MVEADLKGLNTEDVEDVTFMFSHCSRLEALDLSDQDLSNVREALGMFQNCERLRSIRFGQKGPITKKTIEVSGIFEGCRRLENLDLRFCDFSGVSRMARLFRDCKSLQSLTLGKFSMKQVKGQPSSTGVSKNGQELTVNLYYGNLFYGCKRLTRIEVQVRTPGQVVPDAFDSFSEIDQCVLIVPKGCRKRFCKAQGWSAFKTIQENTKVSRSPTTTYSPKHTPPSATACPIRIPGKKTLLPGIFLSVFVLKNRHGLTPRKTVGQLTTTSCPTHEHELPAS